MKYRRRIYYSATQRAEIWDRWQRGESMSSIGRVFDRQSSSVFSVISPTGGIRPPGRRRGSRALSLSEREEISRGLSIKRSLRVIAHQLGRAPSTISREVRRNGGSANYRATTSDQAAWDRALRPKTCKLACHPALAQAVSAKLRRKWSPEQIAGWLKRTFPKKAQKQVSHETIYRSLYIQARGVLKKELLEHLRAKRTVRRSKHASLKRFGADQKRRIDQSTPRVRGRQSGARALGRRSDRRVEEQLYSDPSGTPFAVCDAGQSRQQGHRKRHLWANQIGTEIATRTLQVPDMGSRQRAGRSPAPDHSDRYRRLLLRPTLPVATRFERKHQPASPAISAKGN